MIWAGIAAGGFGLAELVGDRSAEAALAGDTASVAAANTGSSFNLTVMGDPWRRRQRCLVARKSNCVHAEFCIGFGAETIAKANTVIPICIVLWVTSKIRRRE